MYALDDEKRSRIAGTNMQKLMGGGRKLESKQLTVTSITYTDAIRREKPASQIPEGHRLEKKEPKHGYPRPGVKVINTPKK